MIEVKNNYQPKDVGPDSKKIGLQNLKQQYSYFTDNEVLVTQNEATFSVQIPILKL